MKRLLQVCCYQQPQFTCGALILLSEVLKDRPGLITLSHVEEVHFLVSFNLFDEKQTWFLDFRKTNTEKNILIKKCYFLILIYSRLTS